MPTFITHDSLTAPQLGLLSSLAKKPDGATFKSLEARQQNAARRLMQLGLAELKDERLSVTEAGGRVLAGDEVLAAPRKGPRVRKPVRYRATFQVGDRELVSELTANDRRSARAAAGDLGNSLAPPGVEALLKSLVPVK